MHGSISKLTIALILACLSSAAAGCGNDNAGNPDGGGGSGGSGTSSDGAVVDTGEVGCLTTVPTACPTPPVTYAKVQPIFQARCVNICHNGATPDPDNNNAPIWALTDYRHVSDWRDTIRGAMSDCSMPPPDAGVPLTVEERQTIVEFIRCGLPQ